MLIIRRLAATILGFALIASPAMSARQHCGNHDAMAGMEMPSDALAPSGDQHNAPAPCDLTVAGPCASMTACSVTVATASDPVLTVKQMHAAAVRGAALTSPLSQTRAPDTPPPRV